MTELPSGTVTFLFTDIEASTRLWEQYPEAMKDALARHDEIVRVAINRHGGQIVKSRGDGFHAVFVNASAALDAAVGAQRALGSESWGEAGALRVRMGLHSGAAELSAGDYPGQTVNKAARVMSVAHGGQILLSSATVELVRDLLPDDVGFVDLGEHRLRDLSRPERLFQVRGSHLVEAFPSVPSLTELPNNLPFQLTSFVGRDDEVAAVAASLDTERLITLTGVGGVGKTRLALQVAAETLSGFRDGAWICELAAAGDADALLQVVAATLGAVQRADVSLEESVRGFLRVKQSLLVLDNCEHLLEAVRRFAGSVLRDCPGVRIVATSREVLGIAGEQVWVVRSLSVPDSAAPSETIAASPAVRLFTERALAVRPSLTFVGKNATAAGDICRRLDGIPLAIELAAARVIAMTPSEIAARLDARFRLLTGGRGAAVERHQTLRATVDWSYQLLDATERITFDRLGVFAGGFDATAAEAVTADPQAGIDGWDVLDALSSLVAKSMVVADEYGEGTTRYQLLETMRYYALERLDNPDRWRRGHAEHYARFAEEAGSAVTGPEEVRWRRRIRAELDNLRAAVNWALDRGDSEAVCAVRIVAALTREAQLNLSSGIGHWAGRVLPHTSGASPGLRTAVLAAAAQDALGRDDLETARKLALEATREGFPDDCPAPTCAHAALAMAYAYTMRVDLALKVIAEASEAAGGDLYCRIALLARAATLHTWSADVAARREADEAVQLARQLGNPSALSDALYSFSWAYLSDEPAALDALEECIALTRSGASDGVFSGALAQAARLRARAGDRLGALEALQEAIAHAYQTGYRRAVIFALSNAIEVLIQVGCPEPAAVLSGWPGRFALSSPEGTLRAALGAEPYTRATSRGAAMNFDEVVSFVQAQIGELLVDAHATSKT